MGTDNIPAFHHISQYYNTDVIANPPAFSIPAGEHSVSTLGIQVYARKLVKNDPHYADVVL